MLYKPKEPKKIFVLIALFVIIIASVYLYFSFAYGGLAEENNHNDGKIEVTFKENVTIEEAREIIASVNCTIERIFKDRMNPSSDIEQVWAMIIPIEEGTQHEIASLLNEDIRIEFAYGFGP